MIFSIFKGNIELKLRKCCHNFVCTFQVVNMEINDHGVPHFRDDSVTPMMSYVVLPVLPANTTLEFKVNNSIERPCNVVENFLTEIRFIS